MWQEQNRNCPLEPLILTSTLRQYILETYLWASGRSRGTVVKSNDSITCPSWVHGFKPRNDHHTVARTLTIRQRGNGLSLENLYRPACPRRTTIRQIEEDIWTSDNQANYDSVLEEYHKYLGSNIILFVFRLCFNKLNMILILKDIRKHAGKY